MNLSTYLPIDRYRALNRATPLADRTIGAALFADISGFTPLSEKLVAALGPRRGAEAISGYLNQIYEALIECIHRYQGSVISFSGDAITCWFDGPLEDSAYLAVSAGSKMQQAMANLAHLTVEGVGEVVVALKVGIAAGPVRRFVIGDPALQLQDVLAGATIERMAEAEHFAQPGQVVITDEVHTGLGDKVEVELEAVVGQAGLFVVSRLPKHAAARFWDELVFQPEEGLLVSQEELRPWLLPAVYARLKAGMCDLLTELRTAIVLFLRFDGLNYDEDDQAGLKLDRFVRWAQACATAYGGNLLDLTIGDKGSYIYFAFGAPVAHQNEVERALKVALSLRTPPPDVDWVRRIGIGMSQGTLRTGTYGCSSRHTYGVLGDEVNLAARLMQQADERQILVSQALQQGAGPNFNWQVLPDLKVKGKAEPLKVYSLLGEVEAKTIGLNEPGYRGPMIGRQSELTSINQAVGLVHQGAGQIVAISGEAGLGKSRLVAEAVTVATTQAIAGHGGAAQSYGTQIAYLAWQPIWLSLFELQAEWTLAHQAEHLAVHLAQVNPALVPRLPLLGIILNLPLPDNALTGSLSGALRKASLESLLVDYLKARTQHAPVMIVVEDCHWLDPLSVDLLEALARASLDLALLLIIAYRRAEAEAAQLLSDRLTRLPNCTEIRLNSLSHVEMTKLIELKLGQTVLSPRLVKSLIDQAEGNPFYLEELLNFLLNKAVDWQEKKTNTDTDTDEVTLPASLYNLVLSRLDQLNEIEKGVLKVASVIGRLFKATWLWGIYPAVGEPTEVLGHLAKLDTLELTLLNKTFPEMEYLFKHIVTRDVTYESLSHATRLMLHEQVAAYIERTYHTKIEQHLDLLAYHYERSLNQHKQREYLLKAAQAAQAAYSNQTALNYYRRLLKLLSEEEQIPIKLQMCQILELISEWREAIEIYQALLKLAEANNRPTLVAQIQKGLGVAALRRGYYAEAYEWLEKARVMYAQLGQQTELGQVLLEITDVYCRQADYATAQDFMSQRLALLEELNDQRSMAAAVNKQAQIYLYQDNKLEAGVLLHENLERRRALGDKLGLFTSLNNLAVFLYHNSKDYSASEILLKEALVVVEEVGDRLGKVTILDNLAIIAYHQAQYSQAHELLRQCLYLCRELNINIIAFQASGVLVGVLVAQNQLSQAARLAGGLDTEQQTGELRLEPPEEQIYRSGLKMLGVGVGLVKSSFDSDFEAGNSMSLNETFNFALQQERAGSGRVV